MILMTWVGTSLPFFLLFLAIVYFFFKDSRLPTVSAILSKLESVEIVDHDFREARLQASIYLLIQKTKSKETKDRCQNILVAWNDRSAAGPSNYIPSASTDADVGNETLQEKESLTFAAWRRREDNVKQEARQQLIHMDAQFFGKCKQSKNIHAVTYMPFFTYYRWKE